MCSAGYVKYERSNHLAASRSSSFLYSPKQKVERRRAHSIRLFDNIVHYFLLIKTNVRECAG